MKYITITPFWSSAGGGVHVNTAAVGESVLTSKEAGPLEGAIGTF